MKQTRIFLDSLIFVISFIIFLWLESGWWKIQWNQIYKVLIFSLALIFTFNQTIKKYLLILAFVSFGIMIGLYLFWQIPLAEWFGSTAFGMLVIYFVGHLPQLFKKGFVEKL